MPAAVVLLLAQAAPAPPAVIAPPADDALAHFDLARVKPVAAPDRCAAQARTEIVVCGVKASDIAIDEKRFREHPPTQFHLLGATGNAEAVQRGLPGVGSAPAMMVNFKWKF